MTTPLPQTVAAYVQAINNHDAAAFIALFADGAVVYDVGREFRGPATIKAWSDRLCNTERTPPNLEKIIKIVAMDSHDR